MAGALPVTTIETLVGSDALALLERHDVVAVEAGTGPLRVRWRDGLAAAAHLEQLTPLRRRATARRSARHRDGTARPGRARAPRQVAPRSRPPRPGPPPRGRQHRRPDLGPRPGPPAQRGQPAAPRRCTRARRPRGGPRRSRGPRLRPGPPWPASTRSRSPATTARWSTRPRSTVELFGARDPARAGADLAAAMNRSVPPSAAHRASLLSMDAMTLLMSGRPAEAAARSGEALATPHRPAAAALRAGVVDLAARLLAGRLSEVASISSGLLATAETMLAVMPTAVGSVMAVTAFVRRCGRRGGPGSRSPIPSPAVTRRRR